MHRRDPNKVWSSVNSNGPALATPYGGNRQETSEGRAGLSVLLPSLSTLLNYSKIKVYFKKSSSKLSKENYTPRLTPSRTLLCPQRTAAGGQTPPLWNSRGQAGWAEPSAKNKDKMNRITKGSHGGSSISH